MYCEKCHIITENEICPECGKMHHLREPRAEDECLLTIIDPMFGEMLADMLRERKIPFFRRSALGAALATYLGASFERLYFYVPYAHYEEAKDLTNAFFDVNEAVNIEEWDNIDTDRHE